jgi:hypothetical protein
MAASAIVRYYTGASPGGASNDITGITIRYKQADNATQDALNPLALPITGLTFSWRKSTKINFTTSPVTAISNLRFFMGGTPPGGITLYARVQATGIYVQANSADINGITGFTDTGSNQTANNAANYPATSPLTVNAGTVLSNPATGEGTQVFVETQMSVGTGYAGGPGAITSFSVTYRYSES